MTDISIGKTSGELITGKINTPKKDFELLKKEYNAFKKKAANSDMVNSPVMIENELDLLRKLGILAIKESLDSEKQWIDKRILELEKMYITQKKLDELPNYPIPSFCGASIKQEQSTADKNFENYKKLGINIDENAKKIISAFDSSVIDECSMSYLLQKICDDDGTIPGPVAKAVEVLAKASVKPASIPQILNEILIQDSSGQEIPDLSACNEIADLKKADFDDFEALKVAKFLNSDFDDMDSVKSQILRFKKSGISPDAMLKILEILSVENPQTAKKSISDSSVKSVISLKKTLASTRNNEKKERDNPINHLGVLTFNFGNDVIIMKDNKVKYISPVEGESSQNLRKDYDKLISQIEDNLLIEYVRKYSDVDGEINSKYLRVMTVLRNNGIPYDQLLEMTDFCLGQNGIDKNKLNTIIQLKSSGALGIDILPLLDVAEKEKDGSYSSDDIQNICALTSAVIGGKEVSALLPEVRRKENVKEFFVYFSQFFEDKSNLLKLLPLIKDEEGNIDENAMDVLCVLADNLLFGDDSPNAEATFVQQADNIINLIVDKESGKVSDGGAGICSVMSQNGESYEDIMYMIKQCKDSSGNINAKLSEILWDLSIAKTQIQDLKTAIEFCKKGNGDIDDMRADSLISLFEKGYPKDKVIDYIKGMY